MALAAFRKGHRPSRPEIKAGHGTLLLTASLLLLLGAFGAPPAPPSAPATASVSPDLFLDSGDAALSGGAYGDAIRSFKNALLKDPANTEAALGLAEAHLGAGNLAEAARQFAELTKMTDPAVRAQALQGRGIALLRMGEEESARPMLLEATAIDPGLWRSWNALGQTYDVAQDWARARDAYERAMTLRPDEPSIYNNLGVSWLSAGDPTAAETQFAKAVAMAPDLAVAEANLRLALAFQGQYEQALAGVRRDRLPDALNNVGYVALMRGDHEAAEALFLRALEASPTFYEPAWLNLKFLGTLK
jgi:Flp pilus assembly protein TadD